MHNVEKVEDYKPKKRPEAILFYNKTKGGFDIADEMLSRNSTKAASRIWPLAAFFNLLNIVCLDVYAICKNVGIENFSWRCFLFQSGEVCVMRNIKGEHPAYSDHQQQLEIMVMMLSFQRKNKHRVAVAKKTKHVWDVSQKLNIDYTMWFLQKGTDILCWFHVDQTSYWMLKLFTNYFNIFFSKTACLAWKLCLTSLPGQFTPMRLLSIQKFCSIVCGIFVILLSSYFEITTFFQSVQQKFLRFNWLRSVARYGSSWYMHSFLKNHEKLNLGFLFT